MNNSSFLSKVARGDDALDDWEFWTGEEDTHYANDPTRERAGSEVDGTL